VSEGDEVLDDLRRLAGAVDPVPDEVTAYAHSAIGWRRIDAELAELLADSRLETAVARSAGDTRALSFAAPGLEIEVELQPVDDGVVLLGQLAPAGPAEIAIQRDDAKPVEETATAGELGRFRFALVARGRMRVVVRRPAPAPLVETSWFDA
jgi:hypothetical protein